MKLSSFYLFNLSVALRHAAFGTIDLNLNEIQYLAARLDPFECRRLVAALHYTSYELPKSLAAAERKVNDEIPCVEQLLHWNSLAGEGKGNTHEAIAHRLRQLNRNDLADWLGKTTFKQLSKDVERAMARPFGELGKQETETNYPLTIEPIEEPEEEDPWLPIDTILMAVLLGLLGTLLVLIGAVVINNIKSRTFKKKYTKLDDIAETTEVSNVNKSRKGRQNKVTYAVESTEYTTEDIQTHSETDTESNVQNK